MPVRWIRTCGSSWDILFSSAFTQMQTSWLLNGRRLQKALLWLRYQDSNGCGLLEVHEAADWADLLANRFNVLYDNVLWYAALKAMAEMAVIWGRMDTTLRTWLRMCAIKSALCCGSEKKTRTNGGQTARVMANGSIPSARSILCLVKRPYFLPYVAFRDFGDYCDVFGNLLAVLFDVANPAQEKRILDYLHQVGIAEPYPVRVLNPIIYPGNKDWREYYRNNNLNLPEQYHNGGIWPFVGGFYVAALVKAGTVGRSPAPARKIGRSQSPGR